MTTRKTADGYTIQGFKMKLLPGFATEYERRHDELWPEMVAMLHDYGARNYSIFLDPETDTLFASVEVADPAHYDTSAETEICKRWWDYMTDVMEVNPDNSPVSTPLECVFHLD